MVNVHGERRSCFKKFVDHMEKQCRKKIFFSHNSSIEKERKFQYQRYTERFCKRHILKQTSRSFFLGFKDIGHPFFSLLQEFGPKLDLLFLSRSCLIWKSIYWRAFVILNHCFMLMKEETQITVIKQILDNISNIHLVAAAFWSAAIHFFPLH